MNRIRLRSLRRLPGLAFLALAACGGGSEDDGGSGNMAPTVTLGAPATGTAGVAVTLTATAADPDDSVAKVEFFDGATLLGTDTSNPYSLSWTPATNGAHGLTARATEPECIRRRPTLPHLSIRRKTGPESIAAARSQRFHAAIAAADTCA